MAILDKTDAKLLNLLQEDSSRTLADLGKNVGLSVTAVKERLKKLRARGDIRAYVALVNPVAAGYALCAFVNVLVEGRKNQQRFLAAVLKTPSVQECHHVAGEFQYLIKIWASNLADLEEFLERQIKTMPGVLRTQASIVLSSPKDPVTGLMMRARD
jgi:Lrp/AsnC family transcriptional regulator, leucine-responsive regulatory protein